MKTPKLLIIAYLTVVMMCSCASVTSKPQALFNGRDFSGWTLYVGDDSVKPEDVWSVQDGIIHCKSTAYGYMRTNKDYENYILTFEWRWLEDIPGNSGIQLHVQAPDDVLWPNCIEYEMKTDNAGDIVLIGPGSIEVEGIVHKITGPYKIISKQLESNEKPVGQWNFGKIICENDTIVCYVNGVLQNTGKKASLQKGKIALQSEIGPIEFRNLMLSPLGP